MSEIYNLSEYKFSRDEGVFFDTNVWINLHFPHPNSKKRASSYSRAFQKILSARSRIFIDVIVLSEFVNVFIKMEQREFTGSTYDYKSFRRSSDFVQVANALGIYLSKIFHHATKIGTEFVEIDGSILITGLQTQSCDFNDLIIAETCKRSNLKLITDDRDFADLDVSIITANSALLP